MLLRYYVKKLPKTCAEPNFKGHRATSSTVELDHKNHPGINLLTLVGEVKVDFRKMTKSIRTKNLKKYLANRSNS